MRGGGGKVLPGRGGQSKGFPLWIMRECYGGCITAAGWLVLGKLFVGRAPGPIKGSSRDWHFPTTNSKQTSNNK